MLANHHNHNRKKNKFATACAVICACDLQSVLNIGGSLVDSGRSAAAALALALVLRLSAFLGHGDGFNRLRDEGVRTRTVWPRSDDDNGLCARTRLTGERTTLTGGVRLKKDGGSGSSREDSIQARGQDDREAGG